MKKEILAICLILLFALTACEQAQGNLPTPTGAPATAVDQAAQQPAETTPADIDSDAPPAPRETAPAGQAYPAPPPTEAASLKEAYPPPTQEPAPAASPTLPAPAALLAPAALPGRVWTFSQFNGGDNTLLPADLPELNSIEFFDDGRVSIIAGCNVAGGVYSAAAGTINIQAANQTGAGCPAGSRGAQFLGWLNESAAFALEGDTLSLRLPGDAGEMQLAGSSLLTYGDQLTSFMARIAGIGVPQAMPQTVQALMDDSLAQLVYKEGDDINLAFGKAPGAVVLIESPGGSMIQAAGLANVEAGRPMSIHDRLEIGSSTKMFTGVLLTQLQEEGLLNVDDPLSKWLPELAADLPHGESITLRHLATHTSGLPDYGDDIIGAGAADAEALRSGYTPEELVRYAVENAPPDFEPGEPGRWRYSNTGYILLGMVLEQAAGRSYSDLLQARIFDPLGMSSTELPQGSPAEGTLADGYFVYPYDIKTTEWNTSQGWSAGGIISTAEDMAKFARALMTGALFQDPAALETMTSFIQTAENPAVAAVGGQGYGLGLIEFAPGFFGHRGQTIGYTSIVGMDPAKDFILIALTNSAEAAVAAEQDLAGHFLQIEE